MRTYEHLSKALYYQLLTLIVLLLLFSFQFKSFIFCYSPKHITLANEEVLQYILSTEPRPILVFLYPSRKHQFYKTIMPEMDKVAKKFNMEVRFVGYMPTLKPDSKSKPREAWIYLMKNTETLWEQKAVDFRSKIATQGFLFSFIKDFVTLPSLPASPYAFVKTWDLTTANFNRLVSLSERPVVVGFVSPRNSNSQLLFANLQQIAKSHPTIADYYLLDTTDPNNEPLVQKYRIKTTPQIVIFYKDREYGRIKGAYGGLAADEAAVLGLYLKTLD